MKMLILFLMAGVYKENLTQTFNPELQGVWYFKFNISNAVGNKETTVTTALNNFTLEAENVYLEYALGHNSISNRSADQTTLLSFKVQDENGTYLSNFPMKFFVQSDGINYFTDNYYVINTNSSGYANFNFNATCLGDVSGAPKFLVGAQNWKIAVNDSKLNYYQQNDSSSFLSRNLSVQGDILIDFNEPTGLINFTQEEIISFLGATTDDCGDALVANVTYYANSSENSFVCSDISKIGANAFRCNYQTSQNTTRGNYNVTMNTQKINHYENSTSKENNPGLFYILSKKRLDNPNAVPIQQGWGYKNWNFSVTASSGDPDTNLTVSLFIGQTINPTTQCVGPTCINQTTVICNNCNNKLVNWLRNFTAGDIGTWFYQFKLDDASLTSTSGTAYSIIIDKDRTNMTYGESGNNSIVAKDTGSAILRVKVFDIDKNSYNVTSPSATVTFKLLHDNYANGEKIIGTNLTNDSGYANLNFSFNTCAGWENGLQKRTAEINSSDLYYNSSHVENMTIELQLSGCTATVDAFNVNVPSEVFQNNLFKTNGSVTAWVSSSNDVYAILNSTEIGWTINNPVQSLGTVEVGSYKPVSWNVTPSTYGVTNMSMFANSSNAGNDTQLSNNFVVYKELTSAVTLDDLPVTLEPNNQSIFSWNCDAANYRIAKLNVNWNSVGTNVRVYSYDGLIWNDILHSEYVSSTISKQIAILSNQLFTNESGLCTVKFENVGENEIEITDLTLQGYYSESLKIEDIITSINGVNVRGIETSESLINVSVKIANSLDASRNVDVELNIVDSDLNNVNSSSVAGVNINANSVSYVNFTNIPTSSWTSGEYSLNINVFGDETDSRTENLTFKDVIASAVFYDYMCNGTIENYKVNLYHPFNEKINYDVTLNLPSGWSYSGGQTINAILPGNYTVLFNVTSGQNNEQTSVNASIDYSYPVAKNKLISQSVENGDNIPILEVVREMPKVVGRNTVFDAQLSVHNKGCASTSGTTTVSESLSTGWTPANPSLLGDITLQSAQTDLINNKITWQLGSIDVNQYAVLTYQIKTPTVEEQVADLSYDATWGARTLNEEQSFNPQTLNYTGEAHLQFAITAVQKLEFPWGETRSAQLNKDYNYSLKVTNVGESNATGWNVTLEIPEDCTILNIYSGGTQSNNIITWQLPTTSVYGSQNLNFTTNCSSEGKHVLIAKGIKDTRSTNYFINNTNIGCTGANCEDFESFTFSKPNNSQYEKLSKIDFYTSYGWSDYGLTIGEGLVNFTNDDGEELIIWQNYSLINTASVNWINYTINESEQNKFVDAQRTINVKSYTDGIGDKNGNVTVEKIAYTWENGKLFEDLQNLFLDVHPFIFDLPTPVLQAPINNSLQAATPVGLSWQSITPPENVNITYYVFGDTLNATTFLDTTTEALYLWRDIGSATYYWKVIASDGITNTTSNIWQFNLDVCQPDTGFSYALNYPMSYNPATDTITVWGDNGIGGREVMGNNESNAITFVKTTGQAVDFGKQLQINFNATLISGQLSQEGSPFGGSTLSFSGLDAVDANEG